MIEIKNCTCGGEAEIEAVDFHDNYYYVACTECDKIGDRCFGKEEAIRSWNNMIEGS